MRFSHILACPGDLFQPMPRQVARTSPPGLTHLLTGGVPLPAAMFETMLDRRFTIGGKQVIFTTEIEPGIQKAAENPGPSAVRMGRNDHRGLIHQTQHAVGNRAVFTL